MHIGKDLLGFRFLPGVTRVRDFEIFSKKTESRCALSDLFKIASSDWQRALIAWL
jgi:hypothetical protein